MPLWRNSYLSYRSYFKTYTSSLYKKKNAVICFQISPFIPEIFKFFEICTLANWWCLKLNRVLINYDKKRCLSQIVSEMLDSLQQDSTRCAPEYEHTSFVTKATKWVPELSDIKGFASHLWRSILIFADDVSSAWSTNMLGRDCVLDDFFLA